MKVTKRRINSRHKGAAAERELAAELRKLGFYLARRGQQYRGSPDSPDLVGIPGAAIESKRRKSAVDGWYRKAAAEAGELLPLVCHRGDRGQWLLTLGLQDLWKLTSLISGYAPETRCAALGSTQCDQA